MAKQHPPCPQVLPLLEQLAQADPSAYPQAEQEWLAHQMHCPRCQASSARPVNRLITAITAITAINQPEASIPVSSDYSTSACAACLDQLPVHLQAQRLGQPGIDRVSKHLAACPTCQQEATALSTLWDQEEAGEIRSPSRPARLNLSFLPPAQPTLLPLNAFTPKMKVLPQPHQRLLVSLTLQAQPAYLYDYSSPRRGGKSSVVAESGSIFLPPAGSNRVLLDRAVGDWQIKVTAVEGEAGGAHAGALVPKEGRPGEEVEKIANLPAESIPVTLILELDKMTRPGQRAGISATLTVGDQHYVVITDDRGRAGFPAISLAALPGLVLEIPLPVA